MLYAILVCSDPDCAEEYEAWGEPEELDALLCECGCTLVAVAFSEADPVEERGRAAGELERRRAA